MKSPPNHVSLSDTFVSQIKVTKPTRFWDHGSKAQPGLVLVALPSGSKTFYCYYTLAGRKRWLRLGDGISVAAARYAALGVKNDVVRTGSDPVAQREIARSSGTVAELIAAYLADLRAQGRRSARYTEKLLRGRVLKRWGKQSAGSITRADVRVLAASMVDVPVMANSVLAQISAMYTWAAENDFEGIPPNHANPTVGVRRYVTRERERVASDAELCALWPHLSPVLRLVLLTGCRPGEAMNLRSCDIKDGWWCQPGEPVGRWKGTKNKKPHDLRRTWATRCAGAGYSNEQIDRLLNHVIAKKVTRIYNRHQYRVENAAVWTKVANAIMSVIEGKSADVVALRDAS